LPTAGRNGLFHVHRLERVLHRETDNMI